MSFVEAKSYISRYKKSLDRRENKISIRDIPNVAAIQDDIESESPKNNIESATREEEYKKATKYYGSDGIFSLVYKIRANSDFVTGVYVCHYFIVPLLTNFITLDTTIYSYHVGINKIDTLDSINHILQKNRYLTWEWKGQDIKYVKQLEKKYLDSDIKDINEGNINKIVFKIISTSATKLLFIISDVADIKTSGFVNLIILSLRCLDKRGFGFIRIGESISEFVYLLDQLRDFYALVSIIKTSWTSSPKYYILYSQLQYRDVESVWRKLLNWQKTLCDDSKKESCNVEIAENYIRNNIRYDATGFLDNYFNGE
jgi:hypothetical protein